MEDNYNTKLIIDESILQDSTFLDKPINKVL